MIPCYESHHGASIAIHTQPYLVSDNTQPCRCTFRSIVKAHQGTVCSVAQQCRRPGEAAAERLKQQILTTLHLARANRVVQRQRHRA